jgi:hypothetical protein
VSESDESELSSDSSAIAVMAGFADRPDGVDVGVSGEAAEADGDKVRLFWVLRVRLDQGRAWNGRTEIQRTQRLLQAFLKYLTLQLQAHQSRKRERIA